MKQTVGHSIFEREWRKRFGCEIKPDKKFQESFSNTITELLDQPWFGNASLPEIVQELKHRIHSEEFNFNKQEINVLVREISNVLKED